MRRVLIILTLIALTAAACGDDDTGTTETAPTTEVTVTTAAPTTTTEAPTTTTAAPTTTASEPTGPLGVQWPPEGATALYRATTWDGRVMDVEARMERDVEWMGGVWTTFTFGTPEDGEGRPRHLPRCFRRSGVITLQGNRGLHGDAACGSGAARVVRGADDDRPLRGADRPGQVRGTVLPGVHRGQTRSPWTCGWRPRSSRSARPSRRRSERWRTASGWR